MNKEKEKEQDNKDVKDTAAEAAAEQTAETDWQQKYEEVNDQYLRLRAEYDNFRKRSQKERESAHSHTVAYTISSLLPVYDNLERAALAESADENYKKGVVMTLNTLNEVLSNLGVTVIEAERGQDFDPNRHEAMMHIEDPDLGENQIAQVFQKGFALGDTVIRHTVVQVAN